MGHQVLSFPQVMARVRESGTIFKNGGTFYDFLKVLTARLDGSTKNRLSAIEVSYPFGTLVLSDGIAQDGARQPLPPEYLISKQVPFGIVLKNSCEVVESVVLSDKIVDTSQAILRSGYLIGLFELCDYILDAAGPEFPDWTISAGTRTMHFLEMPTNKTAWDRLRRSHRLTPLFHDQRVTQYSPLEVAEAISAIREACQAWRVTVLYFAREWADLLRQQYRQPCPVGAATLAHSLVDVGWRGVARIRDGGSMLYDVLREAAGPHYTTFQVQAAHLLIDRCRDIMRGRRPCYLPVTADDDLGPFGAMVEVLRQAAIRHPCVFRPAYLRPGQHGFLPLAHIVPDAFLKQRKEDLLQVLHLIYLARSKAASLKKRVPALEVDRLLSHMAFRVRTGGARTVSMFQIDAETFQDFEVSEQSYYGPFFSGAYPRPGCHFFQVAVRIQRPLEDSNA